MIELVWDAGHTATARLPSGDDLTVGDRVGLSPIDLAAVAAAASVMGAFMEAAAETDAPVLGYVATADIETSAETRPTLHLRSYVVGSEGMDDELFSTLAERALDRSLVARLYGDAISAEWDLRVLHGV
jgi:uncharacterized OsmC-like protein